jgi:hypothetical protein
LTELYELAQQPSFHSSPEIATNINSTYVSPEFIRASQKGNSLLSANAASPVSPQPVAVSDTASALYQTRSLWPLESKEEAILLRHFVLHLAPLVSCLDEILELTAYAGAFSLTSATARILSVP